MQPNNPNPVGQQPQQQYSGAWDFLNTPPEPPKKKSFIAENKKLVIISALSMILLLVATVLALATAQKDQVELLSGPSTDVPLTIYDGQNFAMSYANSLNLQIDEATEDPAGWYLNYTDNYDEPTYDISVEINNENPVYVDGKDAINELFSLKDDNATEVSKVVLAGVETEKTLVPTVNQQGQASYAVYASTQVGEQYVTVYGTYPKDNKDIVDSFDAMIASITVK